MADADVLIPEDEADLLPAGPPEALDLVYLGEPVHPDPRREPFCRITSVELYGTGEPADALRLLLDAAGGTRAARSAELLSGRGDLRDESAWSPAPGELQAGSQEQWPAELTRATTGHDDPRFFPDAGLAFYDPVPTGIGEEGFQDPDRSMLGRLVDITL